MQEKLPRGFEGTLEAIEGGLPREGGRGTEIVGKKGGGVGSAALGLPALLSMYPWSRIEEHKGALW